MFVKIWGAALLQVRLKRMTRSLLFLVCLALAGYNSWAQVTGSIRGTVRDSTGALVPGVSITAKYVDLDAGVNLERSQRLEPSFYDTEIMTAAWVIFSIYLSFSGSSAR